MTQYIHSVVWLDTVSVVYSSSIIWMLSCMPQISWKAVNADKVVDKNDKILMKKIG